jgi:hypothetical protein
MNSIGIMKWSQLTKLFLMFILSVMPCLNIFGHQEGLGSDIQIWRQFENWKIKSAVRFGSGLFATVLNRFKSRPRPPLFATAHQFATPLIISDRGRMHR